MKPTMDWIFGGTAGTTRAVEFSADPEGNGSVRCVIKVNRGVLSKNGDTPFESKLAAGVGYDMEEAFAQAYAELTDWLV